jgi:hypothetical protein
MHNDDAIRATRPARASPRRKQLMTRTSQPALPTTVALSWLDRWLALSEQAARIARTCLDEGLGMQRDGAQALRRTFEELEESPLFDGGNAPVAARAARATDLLRSTGFLWTETALKVQERAARVARAALNGTRAP